MTLVTEQYNITGRDTPFISWSIYGDIYCSDSIGLEVYLVLHSDDAKA